MENGQTPTVQPNQKLYTAEQVEKLLEPKKDIAGLVKTIVIVILSLIALTFIGLFIWMFMQYSEARDDVDGQIEVAVKEAEKEQAEKDEAEFLEREKYPYEPFSGPVDYGQLSFEYPKTWSVYIAADAVNGGDFRAFFSPGEVENGGIDALDLTIKDKSFDDVTHEYQRYVEKAELTMEAITVNNTAANRYAGKIPGTELNGFIVVIKIRDKTAVLQTDSVLFQGDFDKLLGTITFNE